VLAGWLAGWLAGRQGKRQAGQAAGRANLTLFLAWGNLNSSMQQTQHRCAGQVLAHTALLFNNRATEFAIMADKLDFVSVPTDTLPADLKGKFEALKAAQAAEKAARETFEAAFLAQSRKAKKVPDGKTLRFAYRFGLGVALTDAVQAAPKAKKGWF
jgi:hypothetical protein